MTCLGKRKDGQPCSQRCVRFCRWHSDDSFCSICLEQPADPLNLDCSHSFCKTCIYNWINSQNDNQVSCPLCRTEINENTKTNSYNYGLEQGILEKVSLHIFELREQHYLDFIFTPKRAFLGKFLTISQFKYLVQKLPPNIFEEYYISDLFFVKGKIPVQDYCTIK